MTVEYAYTALATKTPVSLRLDENVVEYVESYAREHGINKTSAYVYFLELGIAGHEQGKEGDDLARAQHLLEGALQIVKNNRH